MSEPMPAASDVYLRLWPLKAKTAPVQQFRVWDAQLFIKSMETRGRSEKKPEDRFKVEVSSRAEYMAERRK